MHRIRLKYFQSLKSIREHLTRSFSGAVGRQCRWYIIVPALLAAVVWTVVYMLCEPVGDDMSYGMVFSGSSAGAWEPWQYPRWVIFHWLHSNGRAANNLAAIILSLPHVLSAMVAGGFVGAFFVLMLRQMDLAQARVADAAPKALLAFSLIYFGMAWWNAFSMIDVVMNYIGTMVLILITLWLWRKPVGRAGAVAVLVLGFIAGAMHEAASWPVIFGLLVSRVYRPEAVGRRRRYYFIAFVAGAVWALSSPGIWHRAATATALYELYWHFVARTVPFTLILLVVSAICLLSKRLRARFVARVTGDDAVWYFAALSGLAFVLYGRVPGRSGWFCESFSLIVLVRWIAYADVRIPRLISALWILLCISAVTVQGAMMWRVAWIYGNADRERNALYIASGDGVVYYDYPDRREEGCLTAGRVRPQDDTDAEVRNVLMLKYRKGPLAVLPTEARGLDIRSLEFRDTLDGLECHAFGDGSALCRTLPADVEPFGWEWMGDPSAIMWHWHYADLEAYIIKPVALDDVELYYIAPIRFSPGSR